MTEVMTKREVAEVSVANYAQMFDLSLSKTKMMDMMPGLLLFLARRPEMVKPALTIMLPMMDEMNIEVNHDLLIEMMPSVVKAVDHEPGLGGTVFKRMVPMMDAFGLKMNFHVMKNVMPMMMGMLVRHPSTIPPMMKVMPKMMDYSFFSDFIARVKGVLHARKT
jgi:hypothetical protein